MILRNNEKVKLLRHEFLVNQSGAVGVFGSLCRGFSCWYCSLEINYEYCYKISDDIIFNYNTELKML